jgi:hypothetical protein
VNLKTLNKKLALTLIGGGFFILARKFVLEAIWQALAI